MKRGTKVHYVKKQASKDEKAEEASTKPLSTLWELDTTLSEGELSSLTSSLFSELSEDAKTGSASRQNLELASAIYGVIVRQYKLKKPLADFLARVTRSYRGVSVLKDLNDTQLDAIVSIIIETSEQGKLKENRIGCFKLLSHLIFEHHRVVNFIEKIVGIVLSQCEKVLEEPKVARQAFNCLGNILFKYAEQVRPKADTLLNVTMKAFHKISDNFKSELPSQVKDIQTVTRCLSYCLSYPKTLSFDVLEGIFIKLYKLLFLGTQYANLKMFGAKSAPQTLTVATANASSSSSGSEISDPEDTSVPHSSTTDSYGKIRTHILLCIQNMCRLNDKFVFDKWQILLPRYMFTTPVPIAKEGHKWIIDAEKLKKWSTSNEPSLLALYNLTKDQKVKVAVANTMAAMIDHSPIKTWQGSLLSLTSRKKSGAHAFMNLSEALGNVIVSFHYIITSFIMAETDSANQLQLLKALSILINSTQYQKIPAGLITYTLKDFVWRILMNSENTDTTVLFCLNCFTSVANQRSAYTEFENEFLNPSSPTNIVKFVSSLASNKAIGKSIECLVLFSKLCKNYSTAIQPYWPLLLDYIKAVFKDGQPITTLGCVRFIEEYVKHHNALIYMNPTQSESTIPDVFGNKEFVTLLENLIRGNFSQKEPVFGLTPATSEMQTALMNVIGIMSEPQWSKLAPDVVEECVNFVVKLQGTGMPQSVALKALGSMITFGLFNKNLDFVTKTVTKIIMNRTDSNMLVATKNSWALANLCYCLDGLAKLEKFAALEECALAYAKSPKEKICSNGIRALGYILKKVEKKEQFVIGKENLDSVLEVVVYHLNVKSPKIAWNSCVAIGNILSNLNLPKSCLLYAGSTFNALLVVIVDKPNVKTKIHAIQALQSYRSKEEYGSSFEKLVFALLSLFTEMDEMQFEDVTEYKYKSKVEAMIIDTIYYMFNLWPDTASDADAISELILNKHAAGILSACISYLRKTLKLESGEVTISKEEAKLVTKEAEPTLKKVQQFAKKLSGWIKSSAKAHVSFAVAEQLNEISNTPIEQFHFMQALVQTKVQSKFVKSFA